MGADTATATPVAVWVRKPVFDAVTEYSPSGSSFTTKYPWSLVTAGRVRPVAGLFTVTSAPATAAPVVSVTVPSMPPRKVCACNAQAVNKIARNENLGANRRIRDSSCGFLKSQTALHGFGRIIRCGLKFLPFFLPV